MGIDMSSSPIPKTSVNHGKHPERLTEKQFRAKVWEDHQGRCRVTGEPLSRTDPDPKRRGEVCHMRCRRPHADRKTDPSNAILMSAHFHVLSDHRGGNLLEIRCAASNGTVVDSRKPIRFTLYDRAGNVLWTRVR